MALQLHGYDGASSRMFEIIIGPYVYMHQGQGLCFQSLGSHRHGARRNPKPVARTCNQKSEHLLHSSVWVQTKVKNKIKVSILAN